MRLVSVSRRNESISSMPRALKKARVTIGGRVQPTPTTCDEHRNCVYAIAFLCVRGPSNEGTSAIVAPADGVCQDYLISHSINKQAAAAACCLQWPTLNCLLCLGASASPPAQKQTLSLSPAGASLLQTALSRARSSF